MTWRVVLTACLALGLALGIRWLIPSDRSATPPVSIPDARFDYTLSDYQALFRNAGNQVELELAGPRLEHVWAERVARLVEPRFHIEPQAADWRGQARLGRILRDDELLILEGEIVLTHEDPAGEVIIQAEELHYDRQARTISSTQSVRVEQADSLLHAGGLLIELDENLLQLTDGVHGELTPATRPDSHPAGHHAVERLSDSTGAGTESGPHHH